MEILKKMEILFTRCPREFFFVIFTKKKFQSLLETTRNKKKKKQKNRYVVGSNVGRRSLVCVHMNSEREQTLARLLEIHICFHM